MNTSSDEQTTQQTPSRSHAVDARRYERHELLAQVHVREGLVDYVLEIANLSRGGALVILGTTPRPRWLALGRQIGVRILDQDGRAPIAAKARVVRIEESSERRAFAIEFSVPLDEAAIRRVLASAGLPPPLPGKPHHPSDLPKAADNR